ncbi:hypothetical protein JOB18_026782 [Solea senegalensis]|uniref:Uncharacterized protein n=1 Tax=Solea senegalensis TaxID=28829 RepID=A0AAV6T8C9_SOLSE|nr:hypothetical protein JOB18_026782 [Solea senegalensis]KAG7525437.1 hypothetical protein JOB18_026782 [Solea senegalensis]
MRWAGSSKRAEKQVLASSSSWCWPVNQSDGCRKCHESVPGADGFIILDSFAIFFHNDLLQCTSLFLAVCGY